MRGTSASGATGDGKFKETPAPATKVDASFLNMLIDELCNVVTNPAGGNMALNPGDNGQLLAAIIAMTGRSVTPDAETFVIGTRIEKRGSWRGGAASEISVAIGFVTPFPAGYAYTVHLTTAIANPSNQRDLWNQSIDSGKSAAGFSAQFQSDGNDNWGASGFDWLCIGYPA